MVIGNYYSTISGKKVLRIIYKFLGTLDLHTHIRLKPVIKFFRKYFNNIDLNCVRILEPGCGSGVNAFEIYKLAIKKEICLNYIGLDLNLKSINNANFILQSFQNIKGKISFLQDDAIAFLEKQQSLQVDVVLLVDIIEHIMSPEKLIVLSKKVLKDNGIFIVSVPTPLYPKFLGREFHNKIGHQIDGYSLELLDRLFDEVGYKRREFRYNTGFVSNIGCWLYYNKLNFKNKYLNFLKELILYPFKFLDFYNSAKVSCSLFAIYEKDEK
jgi:SAM-dependent methyltransferase